MTGTRLSPLDSAFFHLEDGHTSVHIASLAIFEGPPPSLAEVRSAVAAKLPLVPRYRQRERSVPANLGQPVWVDHAEFDLADHVRAFPVPAPGGEAELADAMGELMSRPLDRSRPLWEDWLLTGLPDGQWALVTKLHHSMADGISGTDLLSTVLDTSPVPGEPVADPWAPRPEPGALRLALDALRDRVSVSRDGVAAAVRSGRQPGRALRAAVDLARGLTGFAQALRPVSGSSLVGPIGTRRAYRWLAVPLADVAVVRRAFGGTVNDVVLAAVTEGLRRLLLGRGEWPHRHTVRTLVPVSVRRPDEHGSPDNRVSAILAELPVQDVDPVDQLHHVIEHMRRLKGSAEAEAGATVTELADLLPPALLASALHVLFRLPHRMLSTVTTNVPGPRTTLYLAGRRMLAHYPYVPIADRLRIGVAVTSYEGQLRFGFTADADHTPDLDVLRDGVATGFERLLAAARAEPDAPFDAPTVRVSQSRQGAL
jgi:diacylglycerol O-acyltransferase